MIRRPPRSTLFPYTNALPISDPDKFFAFLNIGCDTPPQVVFDLFLYVLDRQAGAPDSALVDVDDIDRKSTRLNSSHSQISYAVFCLKKKNDGLNVVKTQLTQH